MTLSITGWLFDVYPARDGVVLWFIDRNGEHHRSQRAFTPSFFLHVKKEEERYVETLGARAPAPVSLQRTQRREIYSNEWWDVLQVFVHDALRLRSVVAYYEKFLPHYAFFTSDILVEQLFLYETGLFVLGYGEYHISDAGELVSWTLHDAREAVEYDVPPVRIMKLRSANGFLAPKYQRTIEIELAYEERTYALETAGAREMVEGLNWHLHRYDPDILLTDYGDGMLLPRIVETARQEGIPLLLNRDLKAAFKQTRASSFFQYGKVMHKESAFELRGRWHVDVENSFAVAESNMEGLFEIIRVTQLCPQHQARASIGTGLSSLQLSWAHRNNILIPSRKREAEDFKPASLLLLADRGGLMYMPPAGFHEDVAELDFVSMYPSIMVEHNVSPEMINCRCCTNHAVPELGYTICEKRSGVVPETLRSIVAKRSYYKKRKKEFKGKDEALFQRYDGRQNVLKWMLVSCFGYLGYKNARFGRIEAHESVNAFSRDILLTAKEIAEEQGYRLIHGIIDCVWLKKEGATEADYERLCRDIAARTNIDISLEGIYNWLLFPASKTDGEIATGTRYVGFYRHGEVKMRGIEARRRDTPRFIKAAQQEMLAALAGAVNAAGVQERVPALVEILRNHLDTLRSGKASPLDLVIRRHISKEAEEYTTNSINAGVARMLEEAGVHLAAGERIEYIIVDATGKKQPYKAKPLALYALEDGYDIGKYSELLVDAALTLLGPFGYTEEMLLPKPPRAAAAPSPRRKENQLTLAL